MHRSFTAKMHRRFTAKVHRVFTAKMHQSRAVRLRVSGKLSSKRAGREKRSVSETDRVGDYGSGALAAGGGERSADRRAPGAESAHDREVSGLGPGAGGAGWRAAEPTDLARTLGPHQ